MRAALQGTFRRRLEGRAAQAGICQDQPQQQDPRDRRSRRAGRQALYRDRVRRDPDLSRREDRKVSAQGRGQEIRRAAVAADPTDRGRADVRPMDPFQAVRAQGQRRLFDGPLHVGDQAPLRGAGNAARQGALSRRPGFLHRRYRDLPMDAQPRRPGREVGGQSQSRALVQRHQRAPRGQGRARQDRRHQVEPRDRLRRRQGPLLQSRPLRQGLTSRARISVRRNSASAELGVLWAALPLRSAHSRVSGNPGSGSPQRGPRDVCVAGRPSRGRAGRMLSPPRGARVSRGAIVEPRILRPYGEKRNAGSAIDRNPRGVAYAAHDGVSLLGDLYLPAGAGPFPALVAAHGGGWQGGARSAFQFWGPYLAARGYVLFAISYRVAKKGQKMFPQAVNDVLAGVQFVRGSAAQIRVDAARIGLLGASAGAHLASLAAASGESALSRGDYPNDAHAAVSTKVKALIGVYGVYDLVEMWQRYQLQSPRENNIENFMGAAPMDDPRLYFDASPVNYATFANNQIGVFLSVGTEDDLVNRRAQTDAFLLKLKQANFFVRTCIVQGAPHYWLNDPIEEAGSYCGFLAPRLMRFLQERL